MILNKVTCYRTSVRYLATLLFLGACQKQPSSYPTAAPQPLPRPAAKETTLEIGIMSYDDLVSPFSKVPGLVRKKCRKLCNEQEEREFLAQVKILNSGKRILWHYLIENPPALTVEREYWMVASSFEKLSVPFRVKSSVEHPSCDALVSFDSSLPTSSDPRGLFFGLAKGTRLMARVHVRDGGGCAMTTSINGMHGLDEFYTE